MAPLPQKCLYYEHSLIRTNIRLLIDLMLIIYRFVYGKSTINIAV